MTEVRLRPLAEDDLTAKTGYYREHAGHEVAERFFDAAVDALDTIGEWPDAGSPRIGEEIGVNALRTLSLEGFAVAWFYVVRPEYADVIRLLSWRQDVGAMLSELAD
ncbi:MAG: type II toxin-antitoxin system RelE/ParE family toxin [Actinomycetota bacterium]